MCRYSQIAARAGLTAGPGAKGGDAAVTSEDRMLMEEERGEELDLKAKMEASLIMCSKAGNIQGCEDALDQDAFIDCTDDNGNTPLLLAAQQGNKKLIKALMRRGGNIHHQNDSGCTVLHYCHEYNHYELADYLLSKGADDSLLNAEGLTCYEGLHRADVSAL